MLRKALLSTLLAAVLVGCGGKTFEYHSQNEIPEGPGLLSGDKGHFVIYSDEEKKQQAVTAATGDRSKSDTPAATESVPPGMAAEFQEFKDYEEFRRWKATAKDGPEYREFQEWREWKAYRAWKERHPQ